MKKELTLERILLKVLLHLFLMLMVGFVLLPLFWMIITAFKKEGMAFKLQFLPHTRRSIKIDNLEKFLVKNDGVYFEYYNPSAMTVSIAGTFNSWNKNKNHLYKLGNNWFIFLNLKPGNYEYKFVIDGKKWVKDPENKLSVNGNSFIKVVKGKCIFNKKPSFYVEKKGDAYIIYFLKKTGINNLKFVINGKKLTAKSYNNYWTIQLKKLPKSLQITYKVPFKKALSELYTLENFKRIVNNKQFPFGRFFLNSLIVATLSGILTVIICVLAGYAFAVKRFPFRDEIFNALLLSMMIPGMIYMVPQFALVVKFGWMNTYQGMIIPHLANVFGLLLLRQYVRTIPIDLFQAAKIDGASEFQIITKIVVPLCLPIMVTLFLLVFVGQWSNFLWQLIVNTPDSKLITLPVGLQYFKGQYGASWEAIMAGACFSIIPTAVLFLFAQKYFIEGLTQGAVKE